MLRQDFEQKISELSKQLDAYPFEDAKACHRYFSQQFYIIQNATRYEAIGASLLPLDYRDEFRHRILHLTGEFNHDELIVEDLGKMGFAELDPMYPATRALVSCIYYELQNKGPDALFGISLLLEGLSTRQCDKVGKRMKKVFGFYPEYLSVHDEADAEHYPQTMAMVEGFSKERQAVILSNLELSFFLYTSILAQCRQLSDLRPSAVA